LKYNTKSNKPLWLKYMKSAALVAQFKKQNVSSSVYTLLEVTYKHELL